MHAAGACLVLTGLLACSADPASSQDEGDSGELSVDSGEPFGIEVADPTWESAEVGARIEELAAWALPHPVRLRDVYLEALAQGDASCPGEVDQVVDGSIPLDGCTATTGWSYEGLSSYSSGESEFELDLGDLYITDPDGALYVFAGTFWYQGQAQGDGLSWSTEATGSFVAPAAGDWLGEGATVAFWTDGSSASGQQYLTLTGGVGVLGAGRELYFDDLHFGQVAGADGQPACGADPSGSIGLRDPGGSWYWLQFGDSCDGCGELVYAGQQSMGPLCVELAALGSAALAELGAP